MTEPTPESTPERVVLNSQTLKGVAHPIRLRLLGLLREDGPSTATKLAERIGQSSGVTSYHLRQLAQVGLVVDVTDQGGGRERWWKAAHRSTTLDADQIRESPVEGEAYMRAIASAYAERMDRWLGEMPLVPADWDEGATLSDFNLRLTAAQASELIVRLTDLIHEYPNHFPDVEAPEDTERVIVQLQVMPFLRSVAGRQAGTQTGEAA